MKCQKCQQETFLPFKCPYCGNYYCTEHRLPENHQCQQIELARTPKQETQPTTIQQQKPYEYTITYIPTTPPKTTIHFSKKETTHLTIATLLVISVGLSFLEFSTLFSYISSKDYIPLALFITIFTTSFITHEIAHKITAQKKGLWAEFRLTLMGAILTLFSTLLPFKIISPGTVMISGLIDVKSMGKISIAGPATNITLSTIFLALAFLIPQYSTILLIVLIGATFNAWIALFNLIPFGIFDGFKVFLWNKKNWALAFTASLVLTVISSIYLLNNL